MNKKVRKGIDIGAIVLVVIIFLLGAAILSMTVTKKTDGVPRVFGVTFLDIQTDSMQGTINPADIAVITKVKKASDLKVGDIITFWDSIDVNGDGEATRELNTHRIVAITGTAEIPLFETKGDKVGLPKDERLKTMNDIVGEYHFRFIGLGHFVRFLQGIWGFLLIIILPLSAFLIYRIYMLVKVIMQIKKEKQISDGNDPDALKAELEALRAKVAALSGDDDK